MIVDVKPNRGGGWDVTTRGGGSSSHHQTKAPAVERAKHIAAKQAPLGQVVIRKADNRIQTEHTYGEDPRRRKG